jgi:hypothetical protein
MISVEFIAGLIIDFHSILTEMFSITEIVFVLVTAA